MSGERNLKNLVRSMRPKLHTGEFIFTSVFSLEDIPLQEIIGQFTEEEGITVIVEKSKADELGLSYDYIASWITLNVHSALDAVGLTAVVSSELAKHGVSCNVVSGYYHDHIFVGYKEAIKALEVLKELSRKS